MYECNLGVKQVVWACIVAGAKLTTHLHLVPRLGMCGGIHPLPHYVFVTWCLIKERGNFTLYLYHCNLGPRWAEKVNRTFRNTSSYISGLTERIRRDVNSNEGGCLVQVKVKGKVVPDVLGEWRYSSTHSLTSELDGGVWSASSHYMFPCLFSRSQWPSGLRRALSSAARTLGLWIRIPLEEWMCVRVFLCCFVLCLGRGLASGRCPVWVLPIV
jgi:hypothetical protein